SGNLIWSKAYETKFVYWLTVEAALTPQDLVLIIEPGYTARLDKATGNFLNGYEFNINSDGSLYERTVKYDQGRIFYAGNDDGELLMMLFESTGRPYLQRKSNIVSSFPQAAHIKDGHLFVSHLSYTGTAFTEILMKLDTALNIVFMNEYERERYRTANGIGVSDEGNIYVGGIFGYGGVNGNYYDSYIQKYNPDGVLGTCSYIQSTQAFVDLPLQPVPLAFTPYTISLQVQNFPAMLIPDDIGLNVDQLLCMSTPLCTAVDLMDPGPVCRQQFDYVMPYKTNAGCNLKPIFSYDTSIAKLQSINDTAAIFRFKKLGAVWIVAKLNAGCKTYYDSILVDVQYAPGTFSIGADTLLCPGDSVILRAGKGFNTYRWQDGSIDSLFIARAPGVYYVQTTNACGDIYNDTLVVSGAIVPPLSLGNDREVCISDTVLIQASPGFVNYQWEAQQPFIVQPAAIKMLVNQSDRVSLRARTTDGCYAKDTIFINTISAVPVALGADTSFCEYDSITIRADAGYLQYSWNTGESTPSIVVNKRGNYFVTVQDANGCFARDTMRVIQTYTKPQVSLGKDGPLCVSNSIQFNAGNYVSYLWQDGSSGSTYSTNQAGIYWVQVVDLNGCAGGDSIVVTQILPQPANFLKVVDTFCRYDKLTIVPAGNYSTYYWSTGANSSTLITDKPGIYSLTVSDVKGCKGTDTIQVVQKDCLFGVFIPNAFTPNTDGHNDLFRAKVYGNVLYFNLEVYNRYGQLVFSSKDPQRGWDGLIGGTVAGVGAYAWKCEYHLQGSKRTAEKGVVILVR
ncbi:MAG: gliding motility-associated C-terminal domain-containing protein, partial [Chitinophagaceae bacterium]|nr:gliding motility-associated C-terminal domain-containing protein [Chitinophagaceae bacterium]